MSQLFCLKWNNHISVMNDFKNFLSTEAMVDVTLACDGQKLKAHKIVLSACSPFFRSLFLENPCKHPIVILKDVTYAELKAIIEFMYHGEINITEDKLSSLMKTAQTLRVRGLWYGRSENSQSNEESENQCTDEFESQSADETSHPLVYTVDLSKWRLTRKQSASDSSDVTYEPEIKQEVLTNDDDLSAPDSNVSALPFQIPNLISQQEQAVENLHQSFSVEENFAGYTPNLHGQILTTDNLPHLPLQSSVQSNMELHQHSTDRTSSLPSVTSTHMSLDNLVPDSQQPIFPPDSSSKKLQNKAVLKSSKKAVQKLNNLEKPAVPRRSLRSSLQLKKDDQFSKSPVHSSNLVSVPSTPTSSSVLRDVMSLVYDTERPKTSPASACKRLQKKKELKKVSQKVVHHPLKLQKHEAKDSGDSSSREVFVKIENIKSTTRGIKLYRCKKCSFKTRYSESLKRHVISKHEKTRKFKCDQCTYAAALRQHLIRHIAEVHQCLVRFYCSLCPYKSAQQANMKRHIDIVHEGKKPFQCEQCGFRSAQKSHIKKHVMAIHEQRRDFMCDFCTYRCSNKQNLKRHLKLLHKITKI